METRELLDDATAYNSRRGAVRKDSGEAGMGHVLQSASENNGGEGRQ